MKKLLLFLTAIALFSCSSDDVCPNGKIKGQSNIQDRCFITLDSGIEIDIECTDFDKYPVNSCYDGVK